MTRVELFVVCLIAFMAVVLLGRVVLWFCGKPARPNPWDDDAEAKLHEPDAVSLCPRCLEPEREGVQFCRDCGCAVGPYVMWSPYLYIFALGDLLRTGVDRPLRASIPVLVFLLVISAGEYLVFAPIYWFFLVRNIRRQARERAAL